MGAPHAARPAPPGRPPLRRCNLSPNHKSRLSAAQPPPDAQQDVSLVLTIARDAAAAIRTRVIGGLAIGDPARRQAASEFLKRAWAIGRALGRAPEDEFVAIALTLLEGVEAGAAEGGVQGQVQ